MAGRGTATVGIAIAALLACKSKSAPAPPMDDPGPEAVVRAEPATAEELCSDEANRAWSIMQGGEPVGVTRGRCAGKDAKGWHLVSRVEYDGAPSPDYELHLWLSKRGVPKRAQLRSARSVTRFSWQGGALHIELHGDTRSLEAPRGIAIEDVWVVPLHALFVREAMLRLGVGGRDATFEHLNYVPSREAVIPLELLLEGHSGGLRGRAGQGVFELAAEEPASYGTLRITRALTSDSVPVYVEVAEPPSWEPVFPEIPEPMYATPSDLAVTEIEIPGDGDEPTLAGELVARKGGEGPRPAALFLSGSGPQDRYGFVPNTSIDIGSHEIHDALARAGFVILRYDDRGVGQSEVGQALNAGYRDILADARRALQWLSAREEVDASRVIVVGHSEGALTAAIIAREKLKIQRRRHALAGIVLMGSTGRNIREVIYSQIRALHADKSAEDIESEIAKARDVHDALARGDAVDPQFERVRSYLTDLFKQDPVANLKRVRVPVLLLQGAKDFQVDPQHDFGPLRAIVERRRAPRGSQAHLIDGVDHLFKPEPAQSKVGHYGDLSRRVDPTLIQLIVEWAAARVGIEARAG